MQLQHFVNFDIDAYQYQYSQYLEFGESAYWLLKAPSIASRHLLL